VSQPEVKAENEQKYSLGCWANWDDWVDGDYCYHHDSYHLDEGVSQPDDNQTQAPGNGGNVPKISGLMNINTTKVILIYERQLPNYGTGRFVKLFGDDTDMTDVEHFKQKVSEMDGKIVYQNYIDGIEGVSQ